MRDYKEHVGIGKGLAQRVCRDSVGFTMGSMWDHTGYAYKEYVDSTESEKNPDKD